MHRDESSGILREVHDGIADRSHGGHLELHLHQLRIEQFEQHLIDEPSVDLRHLEDLVVQELLHPRLRRDVADPVVLVRQPLHVVHRRDAVRGLAVQRRGADLRHADVVSPGDHLLLAVAELVEGDVCARTREPMILDDLSRLLAVGEAGEFRVTRRAELEAADAERRHVAAQAREVAVLDALPMRPGLTSDRHAEWVHLNLSRGNG